MLCLDAVGKLEVERRLSMHRASVYRVLAEQPATG
jgi:hypothetical protein